MSYESWVEAIRSMPMKAQQRYVLGFAFDLMGRVAMIKKARPEWQAGLFNGIGGKIEPGETSKEAMSREFLEETGVLIDADGWYYQGLMAGRDWSVEVYTVTSNKVSQCRTIESEEVHLLPIETAHIGGIENIRALIALCRIPAAVPSGTIPSFVLQY